MVLHRPVEPARLTGQLVLAACLVSKRWIFVQTLVSKYPTEIGARETTFGSVIQEQESSGRKKGKHAAEKRATYSSSDLRGAESLSI